MPPTTQRECLGCNRKFLSSHYSRKFCTIRCKQRHWQRERYEKEREQSIALSSLEQREAEYREATNRLPRDEVSPLPAPRITPKPKPFEGDGSGTESFIDIAKDANIPHFGKKDSEVEMTPDTPGFFDEGPDGG